MLHKYHQIFMPYVNAPHHCEPPPGIILHPQNLDTPAPHSLSHINLSHINVYKTALSGNQGLPINVEMTADDCRQIEGMRYLLHICRRLRRFEYLIRRFRSSFPTPIAAVSHSMM